MQIKTSYIFGIDLKGEKEIYFSRNNAFEFKRGRVKKCFITTEFVTDFDEMRTYEIFLKRVI